MKKILERDDTSSRTMVLCVSSLTVTEQVEDTAANQTDNDGDGRGAVNKMEVTTCHLFLCFTNLNNVIRGKSGLVYR